MPQSGSGRVLAVGDIHGQREKLARLMEKVKPTPEDELVFLGDYIDRGPDAKGVIEYLIALQKRLPRAHFIRGNHEQMLLDYLEEGDELGFYLYNGGGATLSSYERDGRPDIPLHHLEFLRNLPFYHQTDEFIFVHAGLRPPLPLEEQDPQDLLWIRQEFLRSSYSWGKTVVFGHTPVSEPSFAPERIALDTGAGHGGPLSCCELRTGHCWSL